MKISRKETKITEYTIVLNEREAGILNELLDASCEWRTSGEAGELCDKLTDVLPERPEGIKLVKNPHYLWTKK